MWKGLLGEISDIRNTKAYIQPHCTAIELMKESFVDQWSPTEVSVNQIMLLFMHGIKAQVGPALFQTAKHISVQISMDLQMN